jgi:hypothetical protein
MLSLNIDSKLCGCHVVSLKVKNVAPQGVTVVAPWSARVKSDIPSNWNEREVVTP